MSNRTLVELNHDNVPPNTDEALLKWARSMQLYMTSGMPEYLPNGVNFKWRRHHSDPCPYDNPLEFEQRHPRPSGRSRRAG